MRRFEVAGWRRIRVRGSHYIYGKGSQRFAVPYRRGDLPLGLVRAALKKIEEVG